MSTQFQNVVDSAVDTVAQQNGLTSYSYASYLTSAKRTVGEAVSEKVASAVEAIRSAASEEGLSESVVENVLIEAGLVDPEPEPEPEVEAEPETLEEKVERLLVQSDDNAKTIAALLAAARSKGITVNV